MEKCQLSNLHLWSPLRSIRLIGAMLRPGEESRILLISHFQRIILIWVQLTFLQVISRSLRAENLRFCRINGQGRS